MKNLTQQHVDHLNTHFSSNTIKYYPRKLFTSQSIFLVFSHIAISHMSVSRLDHTFDYAFTVRESERRYKIENVAEAKSSVVEILSSVTRKKSDKSKRKRKINFSSFLIFFIFFYKQKILESLS